MIGPFDLRDFWQEDLRDESRRTRGKCPEPYEELAYAAWKLAEEKIPVITVEPERTWVWSDLHLGDESAVAAAGRPFNDACRMDRHLLAEWRRTVGDDDTIICLGDVAHPRFWQDPRNMRDLRRCPGHRVLILGNHDVGETERLREAGFTDQVLGSPARDRSAGGADPHAAQASSPPRREHSRPPARRRLAKPAPRQRERRTNGLLACEARPSAQDADDAAQLRPEPLSCNASAGVDQSDCMLPQQRHQPPPGQAGTSRRTEHRASTPNGTRRVRS